jgi:hypothetical protein
MVMVLAVTRTPLCSALYDDVAVGLSRVALTTVDKLASYIMTQEMH